MACICVVLWFNTFQLIPNEMKKKKTKRNNRFCACSFKTSGLEPSFSNTRAHFGSPKFIKIKWIIVFKCQSPYELQFQTIIVLLSPFYIMWPIVCCISLSKHVQIYLQCEKLRKISAYRRCLCGNNGWPPIFLAQNCWFKSLLFTCSMKRSNEQTWMLAILELIAILYLRMNLVGNIQSNQL